MEKEEEVVVVVAVVVAEEGVPHVGSCGGRRRRTGYMGGLG